MNQSIFLKQMIVFGAKQRQFIHNTIWLFIKIKLNIINGIVICFSIFYATPKAIGQNSDENLNYAKSLVQDGYFDMAIKFIMETKLNSAESFYILGQSYYYQKVYDTARTHLSKAIKLKPKMSEAYFFRGRAWADERFYYNAVADYRQAIQINPKEINYYLFYSRTLKFKAWVDAEYNEKKSQSSQDYKNALTQIKIAHQIDSTHFGPVNEFGLYYEGLNNYELALDYFTKAIKLDPESPIGYYNRGRIRYYLKDKRYCEDLKIADSLGMKTFNFLAAPYGRLKECE